MGSYILSSKFMFCSLTKAGVGGKSVSLLVAGVSCFLFGCGPTNATETQEEEPPTSVEVTSIKRRDIVKILHYTGDISGEIEVKVFSAIPERIVSLRIEEGQRVSRNNLIAVVRAEALTQGVEQALGGLGAARAQVEGLQDNLSRQQRLLASGVVTQAQVDGTRFQLRAAESQVAQLEATVGSARTRRSDAQIRAPISGIIGQVFVEMGDMTAPQLPICTIVQMDRVEVTIQVAERDLGLVRAGMEAEIRVASLPGKSFRASVSQISPVVDRMSRTATLRIMLDNPEHLLRPGSLADVTLEVERHENAVVVPQYALVLNNRSTDDGLASYRAYVVVGTKARERQVKIGFFDGNEVEVLDGLDLGEKLVVHGQHLLRDNHAVDVVRRGKQPANTPQAKTKAPSPSIRAKTALQPDSGSIQE